MRFLTVRTFRLNNTLDDFYSDLEKFKVILLKTEYPHKLVDKSVNECLSKKIRNSSGEKKILDTLICFLKENFLNSMKINYKN